jgi:hypothetical protein
MSSKPVDIQGKTNRYWIKKLTSDTSQQQQQHFKNKSSTISTKIAGYKQQDILKKRFNESEFVDVNYVTSLLEECEFKCFYCKQNVLIDYDLFREMRQWSLDRKNNDLGHNRGNVIVSCLECNLQRRKRNMDSFQFTKQLTIQQQDYTQADETTPSQPPEQSTDSKKISCRQKV